MSFFSRRLLALFLVFTPAAALACVNGVRIEKSMVVKQIAKAEGQLAAGDYRGVIQSLDRAFEREGVRYAPPVFAEVSKAKALAAIAVVRSGDTLKFDGNAHARSARTRSAPKKQGQLVWAFKQLMDYTKTTKNAPQSVSWLAEAQVASGVIEPAFKALTQLAKDDLLTDGHGWLTLAQLRNAKEDAKGAQAALTRCKAMAKDASICTLGPGLGGS
jgi:hypothetical protein